jgi:hypothetical protein
MAVDDRFHQLAHNQLRNKIETSSEEEGGPTGIDNCGKQQRRCGGDEGPHIRYEPHEHRENAPHGGTWHSYQPESKSDEDAKC